MRAVLLILMLIVATCGNPLGNGIDIITNEIKQPIGRGIFYIQNDTSSHFDLFSQEISASSSAINMKEIHVKAQAHAWFIKASGSVDWKYTHNYLTSSDNRVIRTMLTETKYRMGIRSDSIQLYDELMKHINVIFILATHNTHASIMRANFEWDRILREYGTDFIYEIVVGGRLIKQDIINIAGWSEYSSKDVRAAASAHFASFFKMSGDYSVSSQSTSKYKNSIITSVITTFGGDNWKSSTTVDTWAESLVVDNAETFVIYTLPITELITPERFPEVPPPTIQYARDLLYSRLEKYAKINTHYGCTDIASVNYDPWANANNGKCDDMPKLHYGGVYQISTCPEFKRTNILTMTMSCPEGFIERDIMTNVVIPEIRIHYTWFGWEYVYEGDWCEYTTRVCESKTETPGGVHFGGAFTQTTPNPFMGGMKCPPDYTTVDIAPTDHRGNAIYMCEAPYDERIGIGSGFGGIFNCRTDNFMLSGKKECPPGYVRHSLGSHSHNCKNILLTPSQISEWIHIKFPNFAPSTTYCDMCDWDICMSPDNIGTAIEIIPPGARDPPPPYFDGVAIPDINASFIVNMTSTDAYIKQLETYLRLIHNQTITSDDDDDNVQRGMVLSWIGLIIALSITVFVCCCLLCSLGVIAKKKTGFRLRHSFRGYEEI